MLGTRVNVAEPTFLHQIPTDYQAPCTVTGLTLGEDENFNILAHCGAMGNHNVVLERDKGSIATSDVLMDIV